MAEFDFLLEIGTEEIPAAFQIPAITRLEELIRETLTNEGLTMGETELFNTPRRLAIRIKQLPEAQADRQVELKGPPKKVAFSDMGRPTPAAQGFATNSGIKVEDLIVRNTDKGEYIFARKLITGRKTMDLLQEQLPTIITKIPFAKSMVWEHSGFRFARPLRWIVALFGKEKLRFKVAGVTSGGISCGLRRDGTPKLTIPSAAEYEDILLEHHIVASFNKRREMILKQLQICGEKLGSKPVISDELLNEVTNLVEYPTAVIGKFKKEYLTLPEDVLVNVMIKHQRFFPVKGIHGLVPNFITIANGYNIHHENVEYGNALVIEARLSDAKFYFLEDQKISLHEYAKKLEKVTFHAKLGSLRNKVERIKKIASRLLEISHNENQQVLVCNKEKLHEACELAKADLQTSMIFEFPELQGRMGQIYATSEGIDEEVCNGIFEHYLPLQRGDTLPTQTIGQLVGLADRIDNLTGGFLAGLQPTGTKDPFAMRRTSFGLIEITLSCNLSYSLRDILTFSFELYRQELTELPETNPLKELLQFIYSRLATSLKDRNIRYDTIDALTCLDLDDLRDIHIRAEALESVRDNKDFQAIVTPAKRASNIVRKNALEKYSIDESAFIEPEETTLQQALETVEKGLDEHLITGNYSKALSELSQLNAVLDSYFSTILVMHEDEKVKTNRISQLKKTADLFNRLADLSKLVIEGTE